VPTDVTGDASVAAWAAQASVPAPPAIVIKYLVGWGTTIMPCGAATRPDGLVVFRIYILSCL